MFSLPSLFLQLLLAEVELFWLGLKIFQLKQPEK